MPRILFPGVFIFVASCAHSAPGPSLRHEVYVPPEFRAGRMAVGCPSDHERYVAAYEDAWWVCVTRYAGDIHYVSDVSDRAWNGWPAGVTGGWDGYCAAEKRIEEIKVTFGAAATH